VAGEEGLDPGGALEQDRRGVVGVLELMVTLLEVGLVAVGGEQIGGGEAVVVGDQREAAVAGSVVGDRAVVEAVVQPEALAD
jgi:predicted alpha/beta-hydrolase family hydrolase